MVESSAETTPFDIGVGPSSAKPRTRRSGRSRRALPTWVLAAIALMLGWVLGTLMNSSPEPREAVGAVSEPAATLVPMTDRSEPAATLVPATVPPLLPVEPLPLPARPDSLTTPGPRPSASLVADLVTVVMVRVPLRGIAFPAEITVIDNGISTVVDVGDEVLAGDTQSVVGPGGRQLLVVDGRIVFMALDKVMVLDPMTKAAPVEIARALYLLPGSDAGHVWAIGSGSRTATDIDISQPEASRTYSFNGIGPPLGSLHSGLVLAPLDDTLGDFVLWSPRLGLQELPFQAGSRFVDAASNQVVVVTTDGLASYNVVSGEITPTERQMSIRDQQRSFVSPDGVLLATLQRGSIHELPSVVIVDVASGRVVDEFTTAFERQLQWVSNDEVLFMSLLDDSVGVELRNTTSRTSRRIAELTDPNFLITVTG